MPAIRGLTVSVGYADVLAVTLVRNLRHLVEIVVITTPEDEATQAVVRATPGARLSITSDFTAHGAVFNKGLAIERAGFDFLGRRGWLLVLDADILLPDVLPLDRLRPTALHGARRRILEDPSRWHPGFDWSTCPVRRDGGPIGFFQLFHATDPAVRSKRPWYNVNYPHAGGCDAAFLEHWNKRDHVILPMDTLHLGPTDRNWWGTDPAGRDMMAAYVHRMGWRHAMQKSDPTAVDRVGDLVERVDVPGYETSPYMMPFEKRFARGQR